MRACGRSARASDLVGNGRAPRGTTTPAPPSTAARKGVRSMFPKTLSMLALSGFAFASLPSHQAHAAPTTLDVTLTNIIEQLVPTKVMKGDREFDGHGPDVTTTVNVKISDDGRKLEARVY